LQRLKELKKPYARKIQILTVGEAKSKELWVREKLLIYLKRVR